MVGLQPRRHAALKPERIAELRHHAALLRHDHEILHPHDLRDGRHHLRRQPRRQLGQRLGGRMVRKQPIPKPANRQMRDGPESRHVMRIDNQPRDLVGLIRHNHFLQKNPERHVRQRKLCSRALRIIGCGYSRQKIAGPQRRRLRHQVFDIAKHIAFASAHVCKTGHVSSFLAGRTMRPAQ